MTDLLTVLEVKDRLRVSKRQVFRWFASGELRYLKLGRRTLVRASEVEAFIAAKAKRAA